MRRGGSIKRATLIGLFAALFSGASGRSAQAETRTLVVVVSTAVPLEDISMATLRKVFTQGKVKAGAHALIPINAEARSTERVLFDRLVLGMEPEEAGRFWVDQKIRGTMLPPKTVPSRALAVKIVENVKGTVAYLPLELVPAHARVLRIDGKLPEDPDYPLRERR
jgi:hypothetical protein